MQYRERTRHLIELGGLVAKSGLDTLLDDDRAALYGVHLSAVAALQSDRRDEQRLLWQRAGKRAFDADAARETM